MNWVEGISYEEYKRNDFLLYEVEEFCVRGKTSKINFVYKLKNHEMIFEIWKPLFTLAHWV